MQCLQLDSKTIRGLANVGKKKIQYVLKVPQSNRSYLSEQTSLNIIPIAGFYIFEKLFLTIQFDLWKQPSCSQTNRR